MSSSLDPGEEVAALAAVVSTRSQAVSALAEGASRLYSDREVLDHQQDIQETSDEISLGSNAAVKKLPPMISRC